MRLSLVSAVALATCLVGCNLFRAEDYPPSPDAGADVSEGLDMSVHDEGLDTGDRDMGLPDTGDCIPESEASACADRGVVCGPLTWTDNCGLQRAGICDNCDPDSAVCDGVAEACVCEDGFVPGDETSCVDIDECADGTDDCTPDKFCVNVPGSFDCNDCPAGQTKDADGVCVDVDECAEGTDDCDPLVTCTNLEPFFECGTCPTGYQDTNSNGTQCDDIDECGGGSDDCDANATCSNQPGSFECTCDPPYQGDGRSCVLPAPGLVAGVHHVTVDLTQTSASVALPAQIGDAAKVVPFATARATGAASELEATFVDVWVDVGAGTVEAERGTGTGTVQIEVALVEFDQANVQTGTYEMDDTESVDVTMPMAFDPAKSFVVFGSKLTGLGNDDRNPGMAELGYDGITLQFDRRIALGSKLEGHWYAVEATASEFSVDSHQFDIPYDDRCASVASTADFSRTMLIAIGGSPDLQNGPLSNPSMGNITCAPTGGDIECCRGEPDPGQNAVAVTIFAVEFDASSNGAVEFHPISVAVGDTDQNVTLADAVDPSWSMATLGITGLLGGMKAHGDLPAASQNAAFGALRLVQNGDAVRVEIGDMTTEVVEGHVQAVTWPH